MFPDTKNLICKNNTLSYLDFSKPFWEHADLSEIYSLYGSITYSARDSPNRIEAFYDADLLESNLPKSRNSF